MDLYSIDAVNEQAVFSEPLRGCEAIRKLLFKAQGLPIPDHYLDT